MAESARGSSSRCIPDVGLAAAIIVAAPFGDSTAAPRFVRDRIEKAKRWSKKTYASQISGGDGRPEQREPDADRMMGILELSASLSFVGMG